MFGAITRSARDRGRRVFIVVHRRELVGQASSKLNWVGVEHGIIAAGFEPSPDKPVQVCSVQTAVRRLDQLVEPDLVVIDKAHHARAASWRKLIAALPQAKLLGVTATPARLDGKGLGVDCGGVFDDLICGPSLAELQKGGYLSGAKYFVPKLQADLDGVRIKAGEFVATEAASRVDKEIIGDAVEQYRRRANHQPAIAVCALVNHAESIAGQFREAGYRAACVHGDLPKQERDRLIAGLGTGEIEVLSACDLISEGLDVPALGAVILLRSTQSLVLHMQQIGRGMRPAETKWYLVVLDHVGNLRRHGRPDIERIWTLNGFQKPKAAGSGKICPECSCLNLVGARECKECGHVWQTHGSRRPPVQVGGTLIFDARPSPSRLSAILAMPYRQLTRMRLTEVELKAYAQVHGYKRGWVFYRLREQESRR